MTKCTCEILAGGSIFGHVKSVVKKKLPLVKEVTVCTHNILTRGGGIFGQVKSVVKKIAFSKGGVV